jgi:hypothetical protein
MSLQDVVVMMHNGEYGRAMSYLELELKDETKPLQERIECCRWLAECNLRMEDRKASGDWYLEAVKLILSQQSAQAAKAKQALPLCEKALECFKLDGDSADVLMAARLRQHLLGLSR